MVLDWSNLNIYQTYNDIHIVGEAHKNKISESLVWNIIEKVKPEGIAIEQSPIYDTIPPKFYDKGGIAKAYHYGKLNNIPVALVDENTAWMSSNTVGKTSDIIETANSPQDQLTDTGDFRIDTILESRNIVREKHGEENYRSVFTDREKIMAERIRGFNEQISGPTVAVVGGFHVHAIIEFLEFVSPKIEEGRVSNYQYTDHRWRKETGPKSKPS